MKGFNLVETLFGLLRAIVVIISLWVIYLIHLPNNLFIEVINFFSHLTPMQVYNTGLFVPAPISPIAHVNLYIAAFQFSLIIAIMEITILALNFAFNSAIKHKAETMSNIIFGFSVCCLMWIYLIADSVTINKWFTFWIGVIVMGGLSLIARVTVLLVARQSK